MQIWLGTSSLAIFLATGLVNSAFPTADGVWETGPAGAVLVLGAALLLARWLLFGGTITLDSSRQLIQWRRPLSIGRLAGEWRFEDVTSAVARESCAAELVCVRFDEHRVTFRVPRGSAAGVAQSLQPVTAS